MSELTDGGSCLSDGVTQPKRRVKRRRIETAQQENTEPSEVDQSESDKDCMLSSSSTRDHQSDNDKAGAKELEKVEKPKPKSKHRIHVPKRADIPHDAFFSQLPSIPSSPYRIGNFHWKKRPTAPSPRISEPYQSAVIDPATSTEPLTGATVQSHQTSYQTEQQPPLEPRHEVDDGDEFSDHIFDDIESGRLDMPPTTDPLSYNNNHNTPNQRSKAPSGNLRQTTLFGSQMAAYAGNVINRKESWPLANREEPPTHHKLDEEKLQTWIYPTNLGSIRDYQFSIVAKALYHNMLVALPTGLGKTFIAATVMLNWFRWAPEAQIVFVAPTKPLVSQQVRACFEIAGIPRSATSMLTGATLPGIRAEEWRTKRVFFMTPQTITNDLKTGICDPKRLVLLVVDEAHRATGGYAYVEVVKFLKRFNSSFRVLALTATPGSSIETVQEVIDGLGIARVEIRTEESIDIRQYVFPRKIETILFDYSEEITMVMDLFSEALRPLVTKLNGLNAYWSKDPMALTPFGCTKARQQWMASDAGRKAGWGTKSIVNSVFTILASLSHGIELLKFHGIGPFFHKMKAFRSNLEGGEKGGKYAKQVNESEAFRNLMSRIQPWINAPDFLGHPKLEYLQSVVLNHFLDAGEGSSTSRASNTRIMVFSHFRDSAEEIVRVLERNSPIIKPHVFVGQANSGNSDGMGQKTQLDVIEKFKSGTYNTLVATSIGEEGLDIGEVDLIICYDASASPIRMLQRMGRTGRKRMGNIVVTLMRGKEETNFIKAKDNYEKMQAEIASGARFTFHGEDSRRIIPKGIQPAVDKRVIDIPVENSQTDLPEPRKRGRAPKMPPKKFHMPDGVRTGFTNASRLDKDTSTPELETEELSKSLPSPIAIPSLNQVALTPKEEMEFEKRYLEVGGDEPQVVEFPRMNRHPKLQREQRPARYVKHGTKTLSALRALQAMQMSQGQGVDLYERNLGQEDRNIALAQRAKRNQFFDASKGRRRLPLRSPQKPQSQLDQATDFGGSKESSSLTRTRSEDSTSGELSLGDGVGYSLADDRGEGTGLSSRSTPPDVQTKSKRWQSQGSDEEFPDFAMLLDPKKSAKEKITRGPRHNRRLIEDSGDDS